MADAKRGGGIAAKEENEDLKGRFAAQAAAFDVIDMGEDEIDCVL